MWVRFTGNNFSNYNGDRGFDAHLAAKQHADIGGQEPLAFGRTIGEREVDRPGWTDNALHGLVCP